MQNKKWREWLPVAGMLFAVLTLSLVALPFGKIFGSQGTIVGLTIIGILAVVFGKQNPIENGIVLAIGLALGLMLVAKTRYGVVVTGIISGYVWGLYVGEILDRSNVRRIRAQSALQEKQLHNKPDARDGL